MQFLKKKELQTIEIHYYYTELYQKGINIEKNVYICTRFFQQELSLGNEKEAFVQVYPLKFAKFLN